MEIINKISERQKLVNVKTGPGVVIHDFVNAYGCSIGSGSRIGAFVEIQKNAFVGERCKISSHTFICEGVIIEDEVFIGHGVIFTNDRFPRATGEDGNLKSPGTWQMENTIVKKGASVGSGSTILCGIEIGENSVIGAGSVVTSDVPPDTIVAGNPARLLRKI